MKNRFVDKNTHTLNSLVQTNPDKILSRPRATSLAWTIIFLADVLPSFALQQYTHFEKKYVQSFGNFSATGELSHFPSLDFGDIDSGPLVLGYSPSATGFTLATQKINSAPDEFMRTMRTLELFGKPSIMSGRKLYLRGNVMGDAILLYGKVVTPRFR